MGRQYIRWFMYVGGLVILLTGCVPVREPLSDISKAEPDGRLVGTWLHKEYGRHRQIVIDAPTVEGNPKGLMRVRSVDDNPSESDWIFPTVIEKETYLNTLLKPRIGDKPVDFSLPGAFAKWSKSNEPAAYLILHYRVEGDTLVINSGDWQAARTLLKKEGYERPMPGAKLLEGYTPAGDPFYYPPPGWLANYLAKTGRESLFPKAEDKVYTRQ